MKLFKSEDGYNVEIDYTLFLISEFKDLYTNRKGDDKLVIKELAYIYFKNDLSSDFQFQRDEEERSHEVRNHVGLDDTWKPDRFIIACEEVYLKLSKTVIGEILATTYDLVNKTKAQMESIDFNEKDKTGRLVYNFKQIIDCIKVIPDLVESVDKAESKFIKQQREQTSAGGKKVKGVYEG
jgi:hypothetical protein